MRLVVCQRNLLTEKKKGGPGGSTNNANHGWICDVHNMTPSAIFCDKSEQDGRDKASKPPKHISSVFMMIKWKVQTQAAMENQSLVCR